MYPPPNATTEKQAVRHIVISDPDNPSSEIIVVESVAPQNRVNFVYGSVHENEPLSFSPVVPAIQNGQSEEAALQPKEHYVLPIRQARGRLSDDNLQLAFWLVTFLLRCRPLTGTSDNRVRVELTGEILKILKQLSPSNDLICLALYYIRRMHPRISEEDKLEHSAEDCQRWACVSMAVKLLYVGMILAYHCSGEEELNAKQFDIPITRAEVYRAMEMLQWDLVVSWKDWHCWLQLLVAELTQSKNDERQAWCAGLVTRVLHDAFSRV